MPVVLTRQGELTALRNLSPDVARAITPLFVLHPIQRDLDTGEPKRSVDEHVRKVFKVLRQQSWGDAPAFVDLRHIDTSQRMARGTHPTTWLVHEAHNSGWALAPTVWPGQADIDRAAAIEAVRDVGSSLCMRLSSEDWVLFGSAEGDAKLERYLQQTGLTPDRIHLVLDLGGMVEADSAVSAMAAKGALGFLPHALDWRSVIVAGSGMPRGTRDVGRDNVAEIPRGEWAVWRSLIDTPNIRQPAFGDYLVQHPEPFSDYDPRYMDTSAQLRYTAATVWVIARGSGMKKAGTPQIHDLAHRIASHPQFSGRGFSWGDDWIADCATRETEPGSQGIWRQVTTNHHLTFVVRQIANLLGS